MLSSEQNSIHHEQKLKLGEFDNIYRLVPRTRHKK
jgi:hypothetical protein